VSYAPGDLQESFGVQADVSLSSNSSLFLFGMFGWDKVLVQLDSELSVRSRKSVENQPRRRLSARSDMDQQVTRPFMVQP
jgi:hypothetical protein